MTVKVLRGCIPKVSRRDPIGGFLQSVLEFLGAGENYVEVRVLETQDAMKSTLLEELRETPLASGIAIPDFATFHESFAGYPRIWLSLEGFDISDPVSRACLEHEAGHAVLHWEISSYMVGTSPPLAELTRKGLVTQQEASLISYLLLIAIKDYQVSCLLANSPFEVDQIAMYQEELCDATQVEGIWDALMELKVLLAARPFRRNQAICELLEESLRGLGSYREMAEEIIYDLEDHGDEELQSLLETASARVAGLMAGEYLGSEH